MIQLFLATSVASARVLGVKTPAFQAVAHLFTGYLIGAWCLAPGVWYRGGRLRDLATAAALVAVEVACFVRGL